MSGKKVDIDKIGQAVNEIILAVGEDTDRKGLKHTPERVAMMHVELLAGMREDTKAHLHDAFPENCDEIILLRDIPFHSICEHHMMPFIGSAHVAYLPSGMVVGVSKLARIVNCFASQLQTQERLAYQIADFIMNSLKPQGVAVALESSHSCVTIRGVKKPGSVMVTLALRGIFKRDIRRRNEVMSLMHNNRIFSTW